MRIAVISDVHGNLPALGAVAGGAEPIVVGGHVHFQFVQRAGAVQWVNAGSVGIHPASREQVIAVFDPAE